MNHVSTGFKLDIPPELQSKINSELAYVEIIYYHGEAEEEVLNNISKECDDWYEQHKSDRITFNCRSYFINNNNIMLEVLYENKRYEAFVNCELSFFDRQTFDEIEPIQLEQPIPLFGIPYILK